MSDLSLPHDDRPADDCADPQQTPRCCPHWARDSRSCRLVTDGLFLPVEEHIVAYCEAKFYIDCRHYQRLAMAEELDANGETSAMNRRRSVRIPQYHIFRFAEVSSDIQAPENRSEESWTIDISQHGIRFVSYRLLPPDTRIHFTLDGHGTTPRIEGQGQVVWSEPLENSPLFHTGIALS